MPGPSHVTSESQLPCLKSRDLIQTKTDSYKGISCHYLEGIYRQKSTTLYTPATHTHTQTPSTTHTHIHTLALSAPQPPTPGPDSGQCGEKARPKHNTTSTEWLSWNQGLYSDFGEETQKSLVATGQSPDELRTPATRISHWPPSGKTQLSNPFRHQPPWSRRPFRAEGSYL